MLNNFLKESIMDTKIVSAAAASSSKSPFKTQSQTQNFSENTDISCRKSLLSLFDKCVTSPDEKENDQQLPNPFIEDSDNDELDEYTSSGFFM